MKYKVLTLFVMVLITIMVLIAGCTDGANHIDVSSFKYKILYGDITGYANSYEIKGDKVVLYDAYMFRYYHGWHHADVYAFADSASITIIENK